MYASAGGGILALVIYLLAFTSIYMLPLLLLCLVSAVISMTWRYTEYAGLCGEFQYTSIIHSG